MHQQEATQSGPATGPLFRPYASPTHHVTKGRYITSNDPRGYIPVYEFPLNGQWIMMDIDDGYILWTGIWKALGHSKADIVKMVDAHPDLAPLIRRVRGGYLKIQGTWMPYEVALRLARRVAWSIRDDLVPLFGPTFPSTCLSPDQPGFGQVIPSGQTRRRARRNTQAVKTDSAEHLWNVVTDGRTPIPSPEPDQFHPFPPYTQGRPEFTQEGSIYPASGVSRQQPRTCSPPRYAPYPTKPSVAPRASYPDILQPTPPVTDSHQATYTLPPIHTQISESDGPISRSAPSTYALPPISALEDLRGMSAHNTAAVLERLRTEGYQSQHTADRQGPVRLRERRRSLSLPPYQFPVPAQPQARKQSIHLLIPPSSSSSSTPSPVSPATPQSATSQQLTSKFDNLGLVPLHILQQTKEQHDLHRRSIDFGHSSLDERHPIRPW